MNWFDKLLGQSGFQPAAAPKPETNALREALENGQRAKRSEAYELALTHLERAATYARTAYDTNTGAIISLNRAEVYIAQGDYESAERILHDAYRTARDGSHRTQMAYLLDAMGVLAQARGDLDRAREHYEQALDTARGVRANGAEGRAMGHLAALCLRESNASYAVHLLRDALPKLNVSGDIELSCYFVGLLGQGLLATGQESEGRQLLDRALRLSKQMQYRRFERHWGIVQGDQALAEGRYSDASEHYREVLALFSEGTVTPDLVHALCQASRAAVAQHMVAQAVDYAQQAVEKSQQLDDQTLTAQAWGAMGMALLANQQHHEAIEHLAAAAAVYGSLDGQQNARIDILRCLANAHSEAGDDDQAIATYQRALEAVDAAHARLQAAQIHRDMGLLFVRRRQIPEAIRSWTAAIPLYEAEKQMPQVARLYCDIAAARKRLGQGQRAIKDYEQALMTLNDLNGDWETRGIVLSNAANAYVDQGDIESAESFFNEAIAIARRTGDEIAETTRRGNYGWFLLAIGRPQQAIAALQYALQMSKTLRLDLQAAIQTDNLGLAYDLLAEYPRALDYHRQAVELIRQQKQPHWEHIFRVNQGHTLLALNEVEAAAALFETALIQGRTDSDLELIVRALLGNAQIAMRRQAFQQAGQALEEAVSLARKADMRRLLAEALGVHSQQQAAINQPESAKALWEEAMKLFTMLHMPQTRIQPAWLKSEATRASQNGAP